MIRAVVRVFLSFICELLCVYAGVGEKVPANCGLPKHEGDPDQEE